MYYLYRWLKRVLDEMEAVAGKMNFLSLKQSDLTLIGDVTKGPRWWMLLFVHIFSDLYVIYCILSLKSN